MEQTGEQTDAKDHDQGSPLTRTDQISTVQFFLDKRTKGHQSDKDRPQEEPGIEVDPESEQDRQEPQVTMFSFAQPGHRVEKLLSLGHFRVGERSSDFTAHQQGKGRTKKEHRQDRWLEQKPRTERQHSEDGENRREPKSQFAPPGLHHDPGQADHEQSFQDDQCRPAKRLITRIEPQVVQPGVIDPGIGCGVRERLVVETILALDPVACGRQMQPEIAIAHREESEYPGFQQHQNDKNDFEPLGDRDELGRIPGNARRHRRGRQRDRRRLRGDCGRRRCGGCARLDSGRGVGGIRRVVRGGHHNDPE